MHHFKKSVELQDYIQNIKEQSVNGSCSVFFIHKMENKHINMLISFLMIVFYVFY